MNYTDDDNYMFMYKTVLEFYGGGLSLREAQDMPFDEFMLAYRNAIVDKLMMTEEGREDIKRYYRLTYEDEDENESALAELFGDKLQFN